MKSSLVTALVRFRYAGPGTQTSRARWKMGWPAYLASSRGVIVAQIDGRGSGGEGDRRRFEMWQRLGSVEVQDQGGRRTKQWERPSVVSSLWTLEVA